MDVKDIYDIVMESERHANLMHIEQDNIQRKQCGDKDYLSVALETGKKFNLECEGTFEDTANIQGPTLVKRNKHR